MAKFDEHINRATSNLEFLLKINQSDSKEIVWQIAVAYYAAVHFIGAHLAHHGYHPRSHKDIKDIIGGVNQQTTAAEIGEDYYDDYVFLENLSRMARYMANKYGVIEGVGHYPKDKHLNFAIKRLDRIMCFMVNTYGVEFKCNYFYCNHTKDISDLKYFKILPNSHNKPITQAKSVAEQIQEEKDSKSL